MICLCHFTINLLNLILFRSDSKIHTLPVNQLCELHYNIVQNILPCGYSVYFSINLNYKTAVSLRPIGYRSIKNQYVVVKM
jgi:hypothetical protein